MSWTPIQANASILTPRVKGISILKAQTSSVIYNGIYSLVVGRTSTIVLFTAPRNEDRYLRFQEIVLPFPSQQTKETRLVGYALASLEAFREHGRIY